MIKFMTIFRHNAPFKPLIRLSSSQTIFALSSGRGKCGVAVIRISGPDTNLALQQVTGLKEPPKPRLALLKSIRHPLTRETLDKGLILWFPSPHSFTGEDCCELQVHGSIAVINSILDALSLLPNLRLAEPGEFTRRAFYNGKLDLTEAEGLADLLQAETEYQRRQAFLQTEGALSKLYNKWRHVLSRSVAHVEAHIDFDETETIDEDVMQHVAVNIKQLSHEIEQHLLDGRRGELLRTGVKTVIVGEPNVGKSSLFNTLCQRPAAIVTPVAGTTRDVLNVTLNIGGYPLILTDTAGLRRKTNDPIEKEGISRARQSLEGADLAIIVIDSVTVAQWLKDNPASEFTHYVQNYINKLQLVDLIRPKSNIDGMFNQSTILVLNKIDLLQTQLMINSQITVQLSCTSEQGVPDLVKVIRGKLQNLCGEPSEEHPSMNQVRHRQHLSNCLHCLNLYLSQDRGPSDTVLMAEYLRRALKHLGYLVGVVTTDQLLDVIFKDFCVGK